MENSVNIDIILILVIRVILPDPGMTTDGETRFINASTCNRQYRAVQDCVVFDLPNGPFEEGTSIVHPFSSNKYYY